MIEPIRPGEDYPAILKKLGMVIDLLNQITTSTAGGHMLTLPIISTDNLPADAPVGSMAFDPDSPIETPAIAIKTADGWMFIDGAIPE